MDKSNPLNHSSGTFVLMVDYGSHVVYVQLLERVMKKRSDISFTGPFRVDRRYRHFDAFRPVIVVDTGALQFVFIVNQSNHLIAVWRQFIGREFHLRQNPSADQFLGLENKPHMNPPFSNTISNELRRHSTVLVATCILTEAL